MSWRGSGNFRSSGSSPRSRGAPGSVFEGGSAGGPPLLYLIVGAVVVGLIILVITAAGFRFPGTAAQPAAQPAAAQPTAAPTAAATAAPAAPAAPAAAAIPTEAYGPALASGTGDALEVESQADQPFFNVETLEATAGEVYTLTFRNTGLGVQHNWVLVEADAAEAVNAAAQQAFNAARNTLAALPPEGTPGLLVTTPMVPPGQEATVSFTAPDAGTYLFICTFPGHYTTMQGELVVN